MKIQKRNISWQTRKRKLPIETWNLRSGPIGAAALSSADFQEAIVLNRDAHLVFRKQVGMQYVPLPYIFTAKIGGRWFGDFTGPEGQHDFFGISVKVDGDLRQTPYNAREILRFAELVAKRPFQQSQSCMCLRGIQENHVGMELEIGCDRYHEAFFSVGCENLKLSLSQSDWEGVRQKLEPQEWHDLKNLSAKLCNKFGKGVTIRQAIHSLFGGTPGYDKHVYSHIMGCAAVVLTADKKFILGFRTPEKTAVNFGWNVPVSGAFDFHDSDSVLKWGLPIFALTEVLREGKEEVGLIGNECSVIPTGFFGDCTRACTPDFSFLVLSRLSAEEFIENISENTRPSQRDADFFAALSLDDAKYLAKCAEAPNYVHHKFLVTLIMALRYLEDKKQDRV